MGGSELAQYRYLARGGKAMTYLVMVVLGNVRQPMNLACCDYEGPTVACPAFPQCDCGYAEGRLTPHYPVPALACSVEMNYPEQEVVVWDEHKRSDSPFGFSCLEVYG